MSEISPSPKPCTRCECLPSPIQSTGRLYLWFPVKHSLTKVIQKLKLAGVDAQLLKDGQTLSITLAAPQSPELSNILTTTLTNRELKDTQTLFVSGMQEPQLEDFPKVTSLRQFISLNQASWLLEILAAKRVTSHFQPIVEANDTKIVFAQEALLRGIAADGSLINPGSMLDVANDAGLLPQLDSVARKSAIFQAGRHCIQEKLFINFSPTSIYDPVSCLRSTLTAIKEVGIPHERIVFEVIESDRIQDVHHLKNILKFYREAGFKVALDDFGAGYSNLNLLHQLRPDFLKLDMELIRNVHLDPYKALITEKILEIAQRLNIKTIAEGIESTEELCWVKEHGANFVQGYLIAKPSMLPVTTTPYIAA
ncbi:MAG: EAL domain-containing protein [Aphanothece sp. CMT-3BRIN-NPC111]|nr:EAL domain-containing protein [Aphanothece sp. CMT-3BRIN-NPC111]